MAHVRQSFSDVRFIGAALTGNFLVIPLILWFLVKLLPYDPLIHLSLLPIGLGLGGGAMIYITAKEVFPEAYSEGKHTQSTVAFLVGLLLMLLLDTSL